MKFAYVDESGDQAQSDIFVMVGFLVDAYRLRRITADFDELLRGFLAQHPNHPVELKTKAVINGNGGWSNVDAQDRKNFLTSVCNLAAQDGKLFVSAISFQRFNANLPEGPHPTLRSYWHAAGMYVAGLIQKKHQDDPANKGLTVLVMDDNKMEMANLSDAIYAPFPWFDCLYQRRRLKKRKVTWVPRTADNRYDHIVNTAFAIKSTHSSLVQVSDALSYVFRRHLELQTQNEAYQGEAAYYLSLVNVLNPRCEKLGQGPDCDARNFYRAIAPEGWAI
ncbi:DUF3800 domain-containing protein [Sphingomonas xanthus]|uniref:DUF3800 domain-containing protein n=1 Tax=Sphingomonas xanthus TaxID=2594473 RepID=A0A516ISY9_9SPHN|nr:DUF3800 domain-containing protein [Sphingomonas xanthus]QDP20021.1 DUF3800 domain-containing protein [Sphingomonas xanthus]